MKICFFLGGFFQNGGIGRVVSILTNCFVNDPETDITALCYFNPHKELFYKITPDVHLVYFLNTYQSMGSLMLSGGWRKLKNYLKENDIDVLIACGALFFPISTLACKGIKTKCICWEHSDPEGNNDHMGQSLARKYGIKRSDLNVVLTKRSMRIYKEKYKAMNTVQIYNPVDPKIVENAKGYNADNHKIISVGRLTYQKNFETAVEVASRVLPQHPDWEWDVFGQGEDMDRLVELTIEKGIEKQMHFRGQVSNLYEKYSDYSLMVMTSRYEGFPMTLLEGMGNGLPLVSFDIPTGPDEIINDGENGFLIKAFDLEAMENKMNLIIDNRDLRERFARESLKRTTVFSAEKILQAWKEKLTKITKQEIV